MNQFTPLIYKSESGDDVQEELWRWEAKYIDDKILKQFDDNDKKFHSMREINQKTLSALHIYSRMFPHCYSVLFPTEKFKLIIRHERTRLHINSENDTDWFTLFVFGYEIEREQTFLQKLFRRKPKAGIKQLLVITPNGEAVMTDDFNKIKIS